MRAVKIVLAAVAAVVVLAIVAVAVVAATFDPNEYKGAVTDAFTARTGRTLVIEQDLRLAYFPWLAVTTGGITIGSAASFGGAAAPFVTATRVEARVKLLPLLARRIEIGTVELTGLTLNLARDAEQRGNWQDLVEAVGDAVTEELRRRGDRDEHGNRAEEEGEVAFAEFEFEMHLVSTFQGSREVPPGVIGIPATSLP